MNLPRDNHAPARDCGFCIIRLRVHAPFRPISHSDLSGAQSCVLICFKASSVLTMEGMEPLLPLAAQGRERALGLATFCASLLPAIRIDGIHALCGEHPRRAVYETEDISGQTGARASMATLEFTLERWTSEDIEDFELFEASVSKIALDFAQLFRGAIEPDALSTVAFSGPEAPMSNCAARARELLDLASTRAESLAIDQALSGMPTTASSTARL